MEHSLQEEIPQHQPDNLEPARKAHASVPLRYLWLTVGILIGLVFLTVIRWHTRPATPPPHPQAAWQHIREQAWEKIQPRVQEAENAVQTLADNSVGAVEKFFEQHKAGARGFAEALLSLQSKWNLIKSKLPSQDKDSHRKFIDEQFAKYIFTANDLQPMEFIWKNKGALTVTAGLTAFLARPEPFIDGTINLAEVVSRPVTEAAKEVGGEVGKRTNWTVVLLAAMSLFTACVGGQWWLKNRARSACKTLGH